MADGVSNWNKFGINAGELASELMRHCGDIFEEEFGFSSISARKKFSSSFSNIIDAIEKGSVSVNSRGLH